MNVYGVIGWKNAGKTSLMERLVAEITGRGFSVSTVKHVHHDVDLDQPGKDSHRHRAAGATEVILASAHRFALMREHRGPEPDLPEVLARLAPVDLVLVEGYKRDAHRKIEVFRAETGHSLIQPDDPLVRAVATDVALDLPVPVLDLNNTAQVADFILAEVGLVPGPTSRAFDRVIVVDWSASSTRSPAKPSSDAIWIGVTDAQGTTTSYHRSRTEAETALTALLAGDDRVFLGFDFPMGYPAGFAKRLTGEARAQAVWRWLAEHITDGPDNRNNRFAVADQMNKITGGPFWGRPAGLDLPDLPEGKRADYAALGLPERRHVETLIPRAQPVWKLYTTGAAGSQGLMGQPLIHRLSLRDDVAVWPFDTRDRRVTVAEIYPSILAAAVAADPAQIKDEAQVRLLSQAIFRAAPMLDVPDIAREEGWIYGAGQAEALLATLA
jgi:molybdopterin-guanine dinucleotide biosynthesis protein B